ncbi:MAG: DUF63 family protein [Euryarchaeota archaeon]|nr:DUF63 family protein [Euryarchaeota archaeon]
MASEGVAGFLYDTYIAQLVCDAKNIPPGCIPAFNPIDTATYALVLGAALYGVLRLLRRWEVKVDERFILAAAPYVLVGSSLRVIEDSGALKGTDAAYLVITPIIYFTVFAGTILPLIICVKLHRMGRVKDYLRPFAIAGLLWGLLDLALLAVLAPVRHAWLPLAVLALAAGLGLGFYALGRKLSIAFLSLGSSGAIIAAHAMDAGSSFLGVSYLGYIPEHVIETALQRATGSLAGFFFLKMGVIIPVIYAVHRSFKPEEQSMKNLVLFTILVLGLAPGIRNTLRMALGV